FIRYADVALDRCHALFRSIKRDDRAFASGIDDRCAQNVRAGHDTLPADTCHTNVESLRHNSTSFVSAQALLGIEAGAAGFARNSLYPYRSVKYCLASSLTYSENA